MSDFTLNINSNTETLIEKFEKKTNILTPANMLKLGKIVQEELKKFAKSHHWKTIPEAILIRQPDNNTVEIYPSPDKRNIFSYLHFGTKSHFIRPVKAKALHWIQNGEDRFSKGHMVSGITGLHWFAFTIEIILKIKNYINTNKNLNQ